MSAAKAAIIAQLKKEIASMQGYKSCSNSDVPAPGLGQMLHAFPGSQFPWGVVHEFLYDSPEDAAATNGFVSGLLATLMQKDGMSIWVGPSQHIFPPALKAYGIDPDKVIFIQLQKEKEILWTMEEALKCQGLAAVIGDVQGISFTASRRLQLAVEKSKVTGFLLRQTNRSQVTTAFITRWKITAVPAVTIPGLPGVGFPCWNVQLEKVKNGKPGNWLIAFQSGNFRSFNKLIVVPRQVQTKTG